MTGRLEDALRAVAGPPLGSAVDAGDRQRSHLGASRNPFADEQDAAVVTASPQRVELAAR